MFLLYEVEETNVLLCNNVQNHIMSSVFKEHLGGKISSLWLGLTF